MTIYIAIHIWIFMESKVGEQICTPYKRGFISYGGVHTIEIAVEEQICT